MNNTKRRKLRYGGSRGIIFIMNYKIGAHVTIAGGYTQALQKISAMGGNCMQIFSASPRGWNFAKPTDDEIIDFKTLKDKLAIDPVYFHASYLINLANPERGGQLSRQLLVNELKVASSLGVRGSIVHLGSFKNGSAKSPDGLFDADKPTDYSLLVAQVKEILQKSPDDTYFIIENAGNRKIGLKFEEIGKIIREVGSDRLKVCLDTCHANDAGYDFSTAEKLERFLQHFEDTIGLDRLELIHANDSRNPRGSLRDQHANIGEGTIGGNVFPLLLHHPKLKNLPFILEVPGEGSGPTKESIDSLKKLI